MHVYKGCKSLTRTGHSSVGWHLWSHQERRDGGSILRVHIPFQLSLFGSPPPPKAGVTEGALGRRDPVFAAGAVGGSALAVTAALNLAYTLEFIGVMGILLTIVNKVSSYSSLDVSPALREPLPSPCLAVVVVQDVKSTASTRHFLLSCLFECV